MTRSNNINTIEVSDISKSFNSTKVVDGISFNVKQNEIFGLIGPNGAGKTTTIRMIMDIIKADSGRIKILGESLNEQTKNIIGYLPEERGLYKKMTVLQSLTYLASLKGMEKQQMNRKAEKLLNRVGMLASKDKKIEELSRGMGQIIQFLITIIHSPQLIILDEPFANLDPVNTELIKEIIIELRNQGRAIILSTHRMNEVEELCDRIFMINKGSSVLYGELAEIKDRYRNNSVVLEYKGKLGEIEGVQNRQDHDGYIELFLDESTMPQQILTQLVSQGVIVNRFEVSTPPLHDIFLQVVGEGQ
ncbi:ABC transporter ATP-binding protein [Chloroflexota bacterium]